MAGPTSTIAKSAGVKPSVEIEDPIHIGDNCAILAKRIGRYTFINNGTCIFDDVTIGRFTTFARNCQIGGVEHPIHHLTTSFFRVSRQWFPDDPIAQAANLVKNSHPPDRRRGHAIEIGNDVWVGAAALVLRGVKVQDGAVIGAGSVVTKDVPPYAIVGGNPAKIIRYRFADEVIARLLKAEWWNLPPSLIANLPFDDINRCLEMLEQGTEKRAWWRKLYR